MSMSEERKVWNEGRRRVGAIVVMVNRRCEHVSSRSAASSDSCEQSFESVCRVIRG